MRNAPKKVQEEDLCLLDDDDVKAILLAIVAGHPDGITEPELFSMAERVQKQVIGIVMQNGLWELVKQGRFVITGATDDDITFKEATSKERRIKQ